MSRRPLEGLLNDSELQHDTRCQHRFGYSVSNTLPLWAGAPCRSPSCPLMEHQAGFAPPPCLWPMIKSSFFFCLCKAKSWKIGVPLQPFCSPLPSLCLQDSVFLKQPLSRGAGACCGISAAFCGVCLSAASCARLFFSPRPACVYAARSSSWASHERRPGSWEELRVIAISRGFIKM